ncbi:hypothetical protein V8E52_000085 [Russula decolorans]|jgi:hypothetical protein
MLRGNKGRLPDFERRGRLHDRLSPSLTEFFFLVHFFLVHAVSSSLVYSFLIPTHVSFPFTRTLTSPLISFNYSFVVPYYSTTHLFHFPLSLPTLTHLLVASNATRLIPVTCFTFLSSFFLCAILTVRSY